jgi:hypothetical protein
VDRYLEIAEVVLRNVRRPLGPKAIITAAYKAGLVPPHLHGQTQHKTLQARISEDIIARRDRSAFYRTAPGLFFLRDFLADTSIPEEFRQPISTRRRVRELVRGPALAIKQEYLSNAGLVSGRIDSGEILSLLHQEKWTYANPKAGDEQFAFIWSFVSLVRPNAVLSYRQGRYRESRDSFLLRRTIGFTTLVHEEDNNLFNLLDFGIVDSGVHAAMLDLDIPAEQSSTISENFKAQLKYFLWIPNEGLASDLVAVIDFQCPHWFEPTKRRLAINDLRWLDFYSFTNDWDDFDPWSKSIIVENRRLQEGLTIQST